MNCAWSNREPCRREIVIVIHTLNLYKFIFLDEQNCGKPASLIEENWALLDILLIMLLLTSVLIVLIVCGVKNYNNQRRNQSNHSVILPTRRPLPPISSDLLPSCPLPTSLLPPPYTIENPPHYIDQDATKHPACDLITHNSV